MYIACHRLTRGWRVGAIAVVHSPPATSTEPSPAAAAATAAAAASKHFQPQHGQHLAERQPRRCPTCHSNLTTVCPKGRANGKTDDQNRRPLRPTTKTATAATAATTAETTTTNHDHHTTHDNPPPTTSSPTTKPTTYSEVVRKSRPPPPKKDWKVCHDHWDVTPTSTEALLVEDKPGVAFATKAADIKTLLEAQYMLTGQKALLTWRPTETSKPLTVLLEDAKRNRQLRRLHLTQLGTTDVKGPQTGSTTTTTATTCLLFELHHDAAPETLTTCWRDAPRPALSNWLTSQKLKPIQDMAKITHNNYQERHYTTITTWVPTTDLANYLRKSGNDGVFIKPAGQAHHKDYKIVWRTDPAINKAPARRHHRYQCHGTDPYYHRKDRHQGPCQQRGHCIPPRQRCGKELPHPEDLHSVRPTNNLLQLQTRSRSSPTTSSGPTSQPTSCYHRDGLKHWIIHAQAPPPQPSYPGSNGTVTVSEGIQRRPTSTTTTTTTGPQAPLHVQRLHAELDSLRREVHKLRGQATTTAAAAAAAAAQHDNKRAPHDDGGGEATRQRTT